VHLNLSPTPPTIINLASIPVVRSVKNGHIKTVLTAVGLEYGLTAYGSRMHVGVCVCVYIETYTYSMLFVLKGEVKNLKQTQLMILHLKKNTYC
jgi:hypothetical protein